MSPAEHAIENAISALENGGDMDDMMEWMKNDMNFEYLSATPDEVMDMAVYVLYTYIPWLRDTGKIEILEDFFDDNIRFC